MPALVVAEEAVGHKDDMFDYIRFEGWNALEEDPFGCNILMAGVFIDCCLPVVLVMFG